MRMENRRFENGIYLFDVKNRKDERKRVTLKSFDDCLFGARVSFNDCLQEKTMEELCQSFAELFSKH